MSESATTTSEPQAPVATSPYAPVESAAHPKRDAATSLLIKQEARAGRLPDVPVLLLLDREADEFLATTSDADAWVTKPLNTLVLRRAAETLLNAEPSPA